MNSEIAGVGGAIADAAADAATDVAAEVVPVSVLDTLKAFFSTWLGGVVCRAILIAAILLIAMFAVRAINRLFKETIDRLKAAKNPNVAVFSFLRYVALSVVYFIAFSSVVSAIPVLDTLMTKLLAAGGVLALVLGVAAQEALGSIASGVMILFFKPFIIGDVLNVVSIGVTGTVEDITLRHTVLKTAENKRVIIPNSTMNGAVVENFDYGEKRVCLMLDVGVTYESDMERALAILADEVGKHPSYLDVRTAEQKAAGQPLVTVRVQELADSAVVLRALLWGTDNGTAFGMKCDLLRSVKNRFDAEGVEFAYPHVQIVR